MPLDDRVALVSVGQHHAIANIYDELVQVEGDVRPRLNCTQFADLFLMPKPLGDAFFQAFCDGDPDGVDRSRFIYCVQRLASGSTAAFVGVLFGDSDVLSSVAVEQQLEQLLHGFYAVAFQRFMNPGRRLPQYLHNRMRNRARCIVEQIVAKSSDKEKIALSDLIAHVKSDPGLKQMIWLLCQNVASIPGFVDGKDDAPSLARSYPQILSQIILVNRSSDHSLKLWKYCAKLLSMPSPDLESRAAELEIASVGDDNDDNFTQFEENPMPLLFSGPYRSSLTSISESLHRPIQDEAPESVTQQEGGQAGSAIEPKICANFHQSRAGLHKICSKCGMAFDARYCCQCGAAMNRCDSKQGCASCRFCARCDQRFDPVQRHPQPKIGIRYFVNGDLQEWFFVYIADEQKWSASWAVLADQFLLLIRNVKVPRPDRVLSLQGRTLTIEEYRDSHDECVIVIGPGDNSDSNTCMLITTDHLVGNRWLYQLRQRVRRRAVEDYYEVGDCVYKLEGLVERCTCMHRLTNQRFFIERVHKDVLDDQQLRKITTSLGLLKLLRHPTLIQVKDVFESEALICATVPQLNGRYLIDPLLQKGHLDEAIVRLVIYAILDVLVRVHEAGLDLVSTTRFADLIFAPHRNLRPESLLAMPDARHLVQITHLDLSKLLSPCEIIQRRLPKRLLAYRSPEALYSSGPTWVWGPTADIWAAGVLMFELLTGDLPFDPTPDEFLDFAQILEKKLSTNGICKAVSNEAKDLIRHLLQPDLNLRPSAASLLEVAWFTIQL